MQSVNYIGAKPNKQHGRSHQNVRTNTRHYEQLQKLLDAYQTRLASVEFRNNVLRRQKKHNYQLEYDRIRGFFKSKHHSTHHQTNVSKKRARIETTRGKSC